VAGSSGGLHVEPGDRQSVDPNDRLCLAVGFFVTSLFAVVDPASLNRAEGPSPLTGGAFPPADLAARRNNR